MKLTHEANRCHKPAMTGNGFYMPPIKMMIGGMVYDIILPTLFGMIMTNKWLVNGIVYYWVYHSKWDVDQQWMLATFVFLVHVLADAIWCLGRPLWWIAENDMGFVRKTDVKRHRYYRYDMYDMYDMYENQDMFHVFTCFYHMLSTCKVYTSSLRKPLRLPTKITKTPRSASKQVIK